MTIPPSTDEDILARTAYGEARGEGLAGMAAVMAVIINRVAHPGWWGHDIITCCQKPFQFSCWNAGDPNLPKLLAVNDTDTQFRWALLLAQAATAKLLGDPTNGAVNYYAHGLSPEPDWAVGKTPCAVIGKHLFFRGD